MSIIDKVISAVAPPDSDEARADACTRARAAAKPGDWLSAVLEHHEQLEPAFARVKSTGAVAVRVEALTDLSTIVTGHSMAEEAALYPALSKIDETAHATRAYTEQSAASVQLGLLQDLDPMSQDFLDKLGHIDGAVAHHVYEEEGTWFLDLQSKVSQTDQAKLPWRYTEQISVIWELMQQVSPSPLEGLVMDRPVSRREAVGFVGMGLAPPSQALPVLNTWHTPRTAHRVRS